MACNLYQQMKASTHWDSNNSSISADVSMIEGQKRMCKHRIEKNTQIDKI